VQVGIQCAPPTNKSCAGTQFARGCAGSGAGGLESGGRRLTQAGSGGFPEAQRPHSTHMPVPAATFTKVASESSTGSSLQTALLAAATRLTQRNAVVAATAAPAAGAAVGSGQSSGFWGANAAGSGDFWRNLTGARGRGGGGSGGFPGGPGAGFNRSSGSSNGTGHSWDGDGLNNTRHGAFNGSAWGGPNGTHNGTWGSFGGGNGTWNGTHGSFNGSAWGANGTWNGTNGGDRGGRPDGRFGRGGDRDGDRRFRRGPPGNGTGAPGNGTDTPTPSPSDTPTPSDTPRPATRPRRRPSPRRQASSSCSPLAACGACSRMVRSPARLQRLLVEGIGILICRPLSAAQGGVICICMLSPCC